MTNPINEVSYIRTSRHFPQEAQPLAVEVNRSYVDIAQHINFRTIGIFATNKPSVTGESWYLTSIRQQTLRQLYTFTASGSYPHGINFANIVGFTRIYGTLRASNGVWLPLPVVDSVSAANQIAISVDSTNINISAGATAPGISLIYVVLEWLSNA